METVFIYFLKSSGLVAAFFTAYYFFLRKETFFKSNRWFLLFGLVTSVILPLVTFKKIIWVDTVTENKIWSNTPESSIAAVESFEINWILIGVAIYSIGLAVFVLKFLLDYNHLNKTLRGKKITQQADFKLVDVTENTAPFSYFNYIVYNSSLYSQLELQNILQHEKVHCDQYHSVDVLVARLYCMVFWFNPFMWLYKKAMLQNLEFIADREALKNISDKKAYQITLLKVTAHEHCVEISNHFYQSLIKKRIIMLNKNQSKRWNSWKYALIIPGLAAFMFYFQVKLIAQEKEDRVAITETTLHETISVVIDKNSTDLQMKNDAAMLHEKYGISLKISKVKRNNAGEITAIKVVYKDKDGNKGTNEIAGDEPIKPIRFFRTEDGKIGFGLGREKGFKMRFGKSDEDVIEIETDMAEAPDAPVAPENVEMAELPELPEAPVSPRADKRVSVIHDSSGKMTVTVNGEVIDIDPEKMLADLEPMMAELDNLDIDIDIDMDDTGKSVQDAMRQSRVAIRKAQQAGEAGRTGNSERRKIARERAKIDLEQSRVEIEQARKELEQSRQELEESRAELAKLRAAEKKQN